MSELSKFKDFSKKYPSFQKFVDGIKHSKYPLTTSLAEQLVSRYGIKRGSDKHVFLDMIAKLYDDKGVIL